MTEDGEVPNSFNTKPLKAIGTGRGSLVFWNPATFFTPLLTNFFMLDEAQKKTGSYPELDIASLLAKTYLV